MASYTSTATLDEYKNKPSSEKLLVAHVEPSRRQFGWTLHSGSIWKKVVTYWVVGVTQNGSDLTEVSSIGACTDGKWYFDPATKTLYVRNLASVTHDPDPGYSNFPTNLHNFTLVTFRLFFSNYPIDLPWNLTTSGRLVPYEGLISEQSLYGASLDSERHGTALESTSTLSFYNNDLYFDSIFDKLIWESKRVAVYVLYSRLELANKLKIFEGQITGKSFASDIVQFEVSDFIFQLKENLSLPQYAASDFTGDDSNIDLLSTGSDVGKYKRRVYGRVDGMILDSAQRVDNKNIELTGTFTVSRDGTAYPYNILVGTGSDLVNEVSPGDVITAIGSGDEDLPAPYTIDTLSRIFIEADTEMVVELFWAPVVANTLELQGASATLFLDNVDIGDTICIKGPEIDKANRGLWEVVAIPSPGTLRLGRSGVTGVNDTNVQINKASPFDIVVVNKTIKERMKIAGEFDAQFTDLQFYYLPTTPLVTKNRKFFVTHHMCQQLSTTITEIESSLRYILVANTSQFRVGDKIIVDSTTECKIDSIESDTGRFILSFEPTPDNKAPTDDDIRTFLATLSVSDTVVRPFIQNLYHCADTTVDKQSVARFSALDYTVTNTTSGNTVTLQSDAEFNIGINQNAIKGVNLLQNSRVVYSPAGAFRFVNNRDYVKVGSTWYEIEEVVDQTLIILRSAYSASSSFDGEVYIRNVRYVDDTSIIAADLYGVTEDDTAAGNLVATAPGVVEDILKETDVSTRINTSSFTDAKVDGPFLVSLALPLNKDDSAPVRRDVITLMNDSIFGCLFNDINYDVSYKVLLAGRVNGLVRTLSDEDVLNFSVSVDSSKVAKKVLVRYQFRDINPDTGRTSNNNSDPIRLQTSYENLAVGWSKVTDRLVELDLNLYTTSEAYIMAQRYAFIHRTSQSLVTINTKLQTIDMQLGDLVEFTFDRLYHRSGNSSSDRSRIGVIIDIKKNEAGVVLIVDDLGNVFNSNAVITPNTAVAIGSADTTTLRYNCYITDQAGIVLGDDDLYGNYTIA